MNLSLFTMPLHPPNRNYVDVLKEDREAIILADQLGFSEAFIGEHITDKAEAITSCLVFIASLIDSTNNIKLGSGTVNLPNNHPAAVAAQVAMLDNMLEGRFLFGISPGGLLSDAEIFGNLDNDRTEMFVESINHILEIWQNPAPYNIKGKYWDITTEKNYVEETGQGVIVTPYQQPHPPIVVTVVAPFSKGVVAAAERGWQPISANFLQPNWVASHWPMYKQGCEQGGYEAKPENWRVAKSIFVADDEKTAQEYGKGAKGPYHFYFKQVMQKLIGNGRPDLFKHDRDMADSDVTLEYVLDSLVICGTVESVVEQIEAFKDITGDFGTLVYAAHDWVNPELSKRSMELMAKEVIPKLSK